MKKVVKIIAMAAMASFLSIGAMSCADSIEDDKPAATVSTESGKNNNEDDPETPATPSPSEDPTPETPSTPETPASTPAAKINLTQDITKLDFNTTVKGLNDTATSDKNGTYMIPASAKVLNVLTPAKDDKAYWYSDKARTKISALQLNADGELSFKVSGAATVKVTFLSTDTANTSKITVNEVENSVTGKTAKEFTWELSKAGDYTIKSSGTSNARITALSIVEK